MNAPVTHVWIVSEVNHVNPGESEVRACFTRERAVEIMVSIIEEWRGHSAVADEIDSLIACARRGGASAVAQSWWGTGPMGGQFYIDMTLTEIEQ